jgi:peptidoglycan/LPS O-acetylase OafA/YrhL
LKRTPVRWLGRAVGVYLAANGVLLLWSPRAFARFHRQRFLPESINGAFNSLARHRRRGRALGLVGVAAGVGVFVAVAPCDRGERRRSVTVTRG